MSPDFHSFPAESESPRRARLTLYVSIFGLAALTCWAAFSEIDQVTRGPAQIIATAKTQVIQSPDAGIVTQMHVAEGDIVKANQLLVTLEKERAQAAVSDTRGKVAALKIALVRLNAEAGGDDLVFPKGLQSYQAYIHNQSHLYLKRKGALEDDVSGLGKSLALATTELQLNQKLEATGDVGQTEILRLKRTVAELESQIVTRRNKYQLETQTELAKAQEDLSSQMEQLNDRDQLLLHTELRAPRDGIVKNVKVTTLGGVVRPGETVMEILPLGGELVAEVKVSPAEIAFIATGQRATVKLDAYDYSIFGTLRGVVSYISPDTLTEDTRQGPQSYYRVLVGLHETEFKGRESEKIQVKPGMTASVDIKAADRTVLSYLLKPLNKTLHQSMGER